MIWSTLRSRSARGFMPAKKKAWFAANHEGSDNLHVGVGAHHVGDGAVVPRHGFKGDVLRPLGHAEHEAAVLAGYETRRYGKERLYRPHQHQNGHRQRSQAEAQSDLQRQFVPAQQQVETALQRAIEQAVPRLVLRFQEAAASIGVRLSDTNPEIRMATTMVTENSCNRRPTTPPGTAPE